MRLLALTMAGVALAAGPTAAEPADAAEEPPREEPSGDVGEDRLSDVVETVRETLNAYGSLRVRFVAADGGEEVQNGASRLGLRLRRDFSSTFAVVGQVEWQVNLVDNPTILTVGDSTSSELTEVDNADAFETRLGWLGVDGGRWGRLTLGKQWSTYYDVAGWTDEFYVFGATSLGVFNAGTDGGQIGTGRASASIAWRGDFGRLSLGAQYQPSGLNDQSAETFGASLRLRLTEWLQVGAAFNRAERNDLGDGLRGSDDPRTIAAGLRLERWGLLAALVYADQRQNDAGRRGGVLRLFDASGYEAYLRYGWGRRLGLFGGGNWRSAADSGLDDEADVEDYYLGLDWFFNDQTFVYVQGRVDAEDGDDAIVFGIRFDFSLGRSP
ncbi:MAG: porin [Proteobacteria bacterium]|nr:porin [Pseudomonadota bacterium]